MRHFVHPLLPPSRQAAIVREAIFAYGHTNQPGPLRQLRTWHLPDSFFGVTTPYSELSDMYSWGSGGKWRHMIYGGLNVSLRLDGGVASFPLEYTKDPKRRPIAYDIPETLRQPGSTSASSPASAASTFTKGVRLEGEGLNARLPTPATHVWYGEDVGGGDGDGATGAAGGGASSPLVGFAFAGDGSPGATGPSQLLSLKAAGMEVGDGRTWLEYIHALIAADNPVPFELAEYLARDHPRNHRFYWGLRWIKYDFKKKWRVYDGPNQTWQMPMELAHQDGLDWWHL